MEGLHEANKPQAEARQLERPSPYHRSPLHTQHHAGSTLPATPALRALCHKCTHFRRYLKGWLIIYVLIRGQISI